MYNIMKQLSVMSFFVLVMGNISKYTCKNTKIKYYVQMHIHVEIDFLLKIAKLQIYKLNGYKTDIQNINFQSS